MEPAQQSQTQQAQQAQQAHQEQPAHYQWLTEEDIEKVRAGLTKEDIEKVLAVAKDKSETRRCPWTSEIQYRVRLP